MRAVRSTRHPIAVRLAVRLALGALALAATLLGTGTGAVLAADPPPAPGSDPGLTPVPGTPADPGPSAPAPAEAPPPAPGTVPAAQAADEPVPPAPSQPPPLFPEDTQPPPNVSNVSLTGEAHVVRQDGKAPSDLNLGRYPRATTEISADLTKAFAAFADPGLLGRFPVQAVNNPDVQSPAWAECLFPESPPTPTEDVRSPGQGAGPTAAAKCFQGAAQAAGFYFRDPGPNATAGVPVLSAREAAATVDATSNQAGATAAASFSTISDVNLAESVTFKSITNQVVVKTNGRPGGAVVQTSATIGGMTIRGTPVELPSDSLDQLGPTLAQLPPVLSPLGVLTFDVVPEQKESAPDGTAASGRAAQLLVTLQNGESTVSFGLGFASARGRTIVNEFAPPGLGTPGRPSPFGPGVAPPLVRPAGGPPRSVQDLIDSFTGGLGFRSPTRRGGGGPGAGFGVPGGLPAAGLNVLPPPAPNPAQNTGQREAYGGNGPWLALIGGSVIGLGLARYLAYSTAVRPTA